MVKKLGTNSHHLAQLKSLTFLSKCSKFLNLVKLNTHRYMYLPCTNSLAVLESICWRSQVTSPWLLLSVLFRTRTQQSLFDLEHVSAVMFGKTTGSTPCSLEIVSTDLPFSSHDMMVQAELEALQENLASSPRTTVRVEGISSI